MRCLSVIVIIFAVLLIPVTGYTQNMSESDFATIPDVPVAPDTSRVQPRDVATGTSRGAQAIGGPNFVSAPAETRMYVNDNTTNRVAFGKIGTGVNDWGLKVSKQGISVDTATNDQLIFNSAQNSFKIALTGTITVTRAPSTTTGTASLPYGDLGYVPAFIAFSSSSALPQIDVDTSTGLIMQITSATINTFTKQIDFSIVAPNYAGNSERVFGANALITYYLLQETVN